jgi:hypothetical protein
VTLLAVAFAFGFAFGALTVTQRCFADDALVRQISGFPAVVSQPLITMLPASIATTAVIFPVKNFVITTPGNERKNSFMTKCRNTPVGNQTVLSK